MTNEGACTVAPGVLWSRLIPPTWPSVTENTEALFPLMLAGVGGALKFIAASLTNVGCPVESETLFTPNW